MEKEAQRVINHARLRPAEADPTAVVAAERFLATIAAQRSSGSGNQ